MDEISELIAVLESELSSNLLLPLSPEQLALIRRSLVRDGPGYPRIMRRLAEEIVNVRLEKVFQGSSGELTDDEKEISKILREMFSRSLVVVKVLKDFEQDGVAYKAGQLVSMKESAAQSLIAQGKVALVIKIGNPSDHNEVLPQM